MPSEPSELLFGRIVFVNDYQWWEEAGPPTTPHMLRMMGAGVVSILCLITMTTPPCPVKCWGLY